MRRDRGEQRAEERLGEAVEVRRELRRLRRGGEAREERAGGAQQLALRLAQAGHEQLQRLVQHLHRMRMWHEHVECACGMRRPEREGKGGEGRGSAGVSGWAAAATCGLPKSAGEQKRAAR